MTSLASYLETAAKNGAGMPDARSEEYRYSRIIQGLHDMSIDAEQSVKKAPESPWPSDHVFHDTDHAGLPACKYSELHPVFRRSSNYFKDLLIAKNDSVLQLHLNENKPKLDLTFYAAKQGLNSTKIHIRVSKGQKAALHLHSMAEEGSLLFPIIFIEAEEESSLEIFYWPRPGHSKGVLCPWIEAATQADSQVQLFSFSKDLAMHRMTFFGYLLGEKSDISLHTSFYLDKNESSDFFVRIFHESPETTSNQSINSVALGSSNMNFNGQIAADKNARQILAYQMFKGLLLDEKAHITARPQLDIEYFDLACSHGVSIGGFTEEELFYLQSRGLKDKEIYPLLTYGFLSEPFAEMDKDGQWRTEIKKELSVS